MRFLLRRRAFSMIEALIVVAILGVGLVTIFGMMLYGTKESIKLSYNAAAINLATSTMEMIRNYPFESIVTGVEMPEAIVDLQGVRFEVVINPEDVAPGLKKLTIVVKPSAETLKKARGRPMDEIKLSTFIANQGILETH